MMDKTYVQCFKCCPLRSPLKIQACDYLIKKIYFHLMKKKNPHDQILRKKPKEQHLNTIPKTCVLQNMVTLLLILCF